MASTYEYAIDHQDHLVSVGPTWGEFAQANDAAGLCRPDILGRSIWDFFSAYQVQEIYAMLFNRVRSSGETLALPFRCDSPSLRRFMTLFIESIGEDGGIALQGRIDRTEAREPVALLDPATPRTESFVVICSWCKRVRDGEGWIEVDEAIDAKGMFLEMELPQLSHGVCKPCMTGLLGDRA